MVSGIEPRRGRCNRMEAARRGGLYGGSRPEGSAGNGRRTTERLYFTFVLAKSYAGARGGLYEVGAVLAAIQHSFGGWDAGAEYTVSPFVRTAGPAIEYNDGYAF